jgi:hypothetical protein
MQITLQSTMVVCLQTVADMVVYNRSASLPRSRLAIANRQTEPIKLKIKVPHPSTSQLQQIHETVLQVLAGNSIAPDTAAAAAAAGAQMTSNNLLVEAGPMAGISEGTQTDGKADAVIIANTGISSSDSDSDNAEVRPASPETALLEPGSVELVLNKITDAGVELLLKVRGSKAS